MIYLLVTKNVWLMESRFQSVKLVHKTGKSGAIDLEFLENKCPSRGRFVLEADALANEHIVLITSSIFSGRHCHISNAGSEIFAY